MEFLKKIVKYIVFRLEIDKVINDVEYERRAAFWFNNVSTKTEKYIQEASVLNQGNNRNNIKIGKNAFVRGHLRIMGYGGRIIIGDNTYIGSGTQIWSGDEVLIGRNVLISDNVYICDTDSHEIDYRERIETYLKHLKNGPSIQKGNINTKKVFIENNVWINYGAIILKGVRIGKGSIVAAGSVVTKDVKPLCIVGGNPAIVINKIRRE